MSKAAIIIKKVMLLKDVKKAISAKKFFKTEKNDYAFDDIFIGVPVPKLRIISKEFYDISFTEIEKLLYSKIHEIRYLAILILVNFAKKKIHNLQIVYNFYIDHVKQINNWDLVDISAPIIVGRYLLDKEKGVLYRLAKSTNLWSRRIAILSTKYFIEQKQYNTTLEMVKILLNDKEDLIHKALGWMLREIGKQNINYLLNFLNRYRSELPRVTLRYAIEKLDSDKRKFYLRKPLQNK